MLGPSEGVIALTIKGLDVQVRLWRWPGKKIDDMLPPAVHHRRHRPVVQIVEPPAVKSKTTIRKIRNHRGKIQFTVEPWFNRVLIRRGNIGKMRSHKRTHMAGHDFLP